MDSLWLIALSISASVIAQTIIKIGVSQPDVMQARPSWLAPIAMIMQSPLIVAGLALYGVGALAWIMVLSRLNLSYAYPFLALNFILITLVSRLFLGETIPPLRWFGLAFICIGIWFVARSSIN